MKITDPKVRRKYDLARLCYYLKKTPSEIRREDRTTLYEVLIAIEEISSTKLLPE